MSTELSYKARLRATSSRYHLPAHRYRTVVHSDKNIPNPAEKQNLISFQNFSTYELRRKEFKLNVVLSDKGKRLPGEAQ